MSFLKIGDRVIVTNLSSSFAGLVGTVMSEPSIETIAISSAPPNDLFVTSYDMTIEFDHDTAILNDSYVLRHEYQIVQMMYDDLPDRASSHGLSAFIDYFLLLQQIQKNNLINDIMRHVCLDRLAPEYIVGLLRINFPIKNEIECWDDFLIRTKSEFILRKIPNVDKILQGL
jgi:hypothetical protein